MGITRRSQSIWNPLMDLGMQGSRTYELASRGQIQYAYSKATTYTGLIDRDNCSAMLSPPGSQAENVELVAISSGIRNKVRHVESRPWVEQIVHWKSERRQAASKFYSQI